MPPTDAPRIRSQLVVRRILLALLALGFVASILANIALFRFGLSKYRAELALRLDPTSADRFPTNSRIAPSPGLRIVLFGDSRVAEWNPLPALPEAQIVNQGLPGETSAQALERLERDVLSLNPDLVVLQYGINDLKAIGVFPERAQEITSACDRHVRQLVERLAQRDTRVLLLTIFPVGSVPLGRRFLWSNATIDAVQQMNAKWVRELRGPKVEVVDADQALRDSTTGRVREELARDEFHLNRAGYEALNRALAPALLALTKNP